MKAVLVRPTVSTNDRYSKPIESLGIAYVAGALRQAGHDVVLLDAMLAELSTEETILKIQDLKPDLLAFTVVFNYFPPEIALIAARVRASHPQTKIFVGGHASSFFPESILDRYPDIDAVVIGEGEDAIVAVATAVSEGAPFAGISGVVTRTPSGALVRSHPKRLTRLDKLTRPARDLVPQLLENDGLICLSTSRGCYARCTFCSIPRFYGLSSGKRHATGAWLSREVSDSVDEIEQLHQQFGLLELLVVDDEFFGGTTEGRDRAFAFAECLAGRALPIELAISCRAENVEPDIMIALARAGVAHVFVGVESGIERELKLFGKKHSTDQNTRAASLIKSAGMSFQAGYMIFNHRTTLDDLRVNLAYLRDIGECKPWQINSSVEPHFGTPLADLMEREGGALIGELSMMSAYPDPDIRLARDLISDICGFFVPFQGVIQRMQSAITVEWRRPVPGRSDAVKQALAEMERTIHVACAELVEAAIELVAEKLMPDQVRSIMADRKAAVEPTLWRTVGLVGLQIEREEGEIKYHTQLDRIRARSAATGIRYPGLSGLQT